MLYAACAAGMLVAGASASAGAALDAALLRGMAAMVVLATAAWLLLSVARRPAPVVASPLLVEEIPDSNSDELATDSAEAGPLAESIPLAVEVDR